MLLMYEGTGIRWIKFILIVFSTILVITGISLVIIGTTINAIYEEFSSFIASIYFSPATFLIYVGFLIFGIASLGCIGAIKESTFTIVTFGTLLGITSILQLGAGLSNSILMSDMDQEVIHNLNKTLFSYSRSEQSKKFIDNLQEELYCCGFYGPKDWRVINRSDNIPQSCCALEENGRCQKAYNNGCYIILNTIFAESSKILTTSAYLLAFTQIFGMLFAFYLAKMLKAQKLAREYRRWAIRNQLLYSCAYDPYSYDFKDQFSHFNKL